MKRLTYTPKPKSKIDLKAVITTPPVVKPYPNLEDFPATIID